MVENENRLCYHQSENRDLREVQMKAGKLLVRNFDARIPKIEIRPRGARSNIVVFSKMHDENGGGRVNVKIVFEEVAAIEFCVNYFDNMVGAEAFGLYEIEDADFVDSVVRRNFERRREVFLLEGDYSYNAGEPGDMLNAFDLLGNYEKEKESWHAYVQNVDAGVYIVIAKGYQIVR